MGCARYSSVEVKLQGFQWIIEYKYVQEAAHLLEVISVASRLGRSYAAALLIICASIQL